MSHIVLINGNSVMAPKLKPVVHDKIPVVLKTLYHTKIKIEFSHLNMTQLV